MFEKEAKEDYLSNLRGKVDNNLWIRYRTCKDCADYMLESKNCYKTEKCFYK